MAFCFWYGICSIYEQAKDSRMEKPIRDGMMKENTIYITLPDINFQKEVLESTQPILVEFEADWWGPCHIMAPIIEELPPDFKGLISMGKLDIDNYEGVAKEYGIWHLPTFLFFKNGQVVDHIIKELFQRMI